MTPAGPKVASRSWYSEPANQFLGCEFYLFWVSEVDVCSKCDFGELDHAGCVVVTQYVSWVEPPVYYVVIMEISERFVDLGKSHSCLRLGQSFLLVLHGEIGLRWEAGGMNRQVFRTVSDDVD